MMMSLESCGKAVVARPLDEYATELLGYDRMLHIRFPTTGTLQR